MTHYDGYDNLNSQSDTLVKEQYSFRLIRLDVPNTANIIARFIHNYAKNNAKKNMFYALPAILIPPRPGNEIKNLPAVLHRACLYVILNTNLINTLSGSLFSVIFLSRFYRNRNKTKNFSKNIYKKSVQIN